MKPISELCKEKIVWGAWTVRDQDIHEHPEWIRELGLDFIYYGLKDDHSNAKEVLDICAANGFGAVVFDPQASDLTMDRFYCMKNAVEDYCDHPALFTTCLRDEPGAYDLPRLALLAKEYRKVTGKDAQINLFPSYANELQLNFVDYPTYIDRCASELPIPSVSYDHYPLYGPNGRTWVQEHYLYDFETVAEACRKYGKDMWYFIQTLAFNRIVRDPSEQDLRWQLYSAFSFGAKVIQLFTYARPGDENGVCGNEIFEDSLIDFHGNKTPRYDSMKKVMEEVNAFGPEYVRYSWDGAIVDKAGLVESEAPEEIEVTFPGLVITRRVKNNYLELRHPLSSYGPITGIRGELPVLAGCMSRGEEQAFTLVNASDPGLRLSNRVSVSFSRPVCLRVWRFGKSEELPAADTFETELECGQGLWIQIIG